MKLNEVLKSNKKLPIKVMENDIKTFDLKTLYQIGKNFIIHAKGDVDISNCGLKKLPAKFNKCERSFACGGNVLVTLEGCPSIIERGFYCAYNRLKTLENGPILCGGNYECNDNQLTTLKGTPKIILGTFDCSSNQIKSLEFCPEEIEGTGRFGNNKLVSLVGINKYLKKCNSISFKNNHIEEGGIGLLLIDNLKVVNSSDCGDFSKATSIINKYLDEGGGKQFLLACQEELEEAGLERYAKL